MTRNVNAGDGADLARQFGDRLLEVRSPGVDVSEASVITVPFAWLWDGRQNEAIRPRDDHP